MSDFPLEGDVTVTRQWLDKKGFENKFVNWEADLFFFLEKSDLMTGFTLTAEKALYLYCVIEKAKMRAGIYPFSIVMH